MSEAAHEHGTLTPDLLSVDGTSETKNPRKTRLRSPLETDLSVREIQLMITAQLDPRELSHAGDRGERTDYLITTVFNGLEITKPFDELRDLDRQVGASSQETSRALAEAKKIVVEAELQGRSRELMAQLFDIDDKYAKTNLLRAFDTLLKHSRINGYRNEIVKARRIALVMLANQ